MIKGIFKGLSVFAVAGLLSLAACTTEQDAQTTASVKASQAPVSQQYAGKTVGSPAGKTAVKAGVASADAKASASDFEPSKPAATASKKSSRWSFSEKVSETTVADEDAESESYIPYILIALLVVIVAIFYIRKSK